MTLTDFDDLVLTVSLEIFIQGLLFQSLCCMASELETQKVDFLTKFRLNPWYLINHNFEHNLLTYDLHL